MIGDVVKVWAGRRESTVLVRDQFDGVTKACFVDMREPLGPWMAGLCKRASERGRQVILELSPRTERGYRIVDANLLPELPQPGEEPTNGVA